MAVGSLEQARGDLRHGEAAHRLERKGDAHLGRQRGMADGEQQRQLVVAQLAVEMAVALRAAAASNGSSLVDQRHAARLVPQQIERAVAGDDGEPGFGLVGHALERPRRQRLHQRVLDGILGDGDAAGAQPPRQGGDQPARRIAGQRIDEPMDGRWTGASVGGLRLVDRHVVDRPDLDPVGAVPRDAGSPWRSPRPRPHPWPRSRSSRRSRPWPRHRARRWRPACRP